MAWGVAKAATVRVVSRRNQIENGFLFSVRQAAAACNVSPPEGSREEDDRPPEDEDGGSAEVALPGADTGAAVD
jgi:hypothetical protein